jgi:hypothetical protein
VEDFGPGGADTTVGRAWRPRPEHDRFIRRLLALTEGRGIAVYWLTSTLSPGTQSYRERYGFDAAYEAFLRRMQGEFPHLVVLDSRRLGLDRTAFIDPVHLDARGASILSVAVADAIAGEGPAESRWVSLAPRPAPDDPRMARAGAAVNK